MRTKILYEDAQILIIQKPAGLATQSAKVAQTDVFSELKNHVHGGYIGIVHRLDQPVEGLLVFAKDSKTCAGLNNALKNDQLNKEYEALVWGQVPACGELEHYLSKGEDRLAHVCRKQDADAKRAHLSYERMGVSADGEISLVQIRLSTGRFHQIRAQFAAAGHALLGDRKYGNAETLEKSGSLGIRNVALAANRICVIHPVTGKEISYSYQPDFEKLL